MPSPGSSLLGKKPPVLPVKGNLGRSRSSNSQLSIVTMVKYCSYGIVGWIFWKFLFYTEPLPLDQLSSFQNQSVVEFTTDSGVFVMQLYTQDAPKTTSHFLELVQNGFYTQGDTGFYRHEPGHVLQAGGFVHDKKPTTRASLPIEYKRPSIERTVVMARQTKDVLSGDSEFAIMLQNNSLINQPSLDDGNPGYTTFGRIIEGWAVLQRIATSMGPVGYTDRASVVTFTSVTRATRLLPTGQDLALEHAYDRIRSVLDASPYSVVVFSKTTCPFCTRTKEILRQARASIEIVELDQEVSGSKIQDVLEVLTGRRTVPNVFLNQNSIGGGDDLEALRNSGKLHNMLERAGALAKDFVLSRVHDVALVVFSKSTCPHCHKAKDILFHQLGVPELNNPQVLVIELDQRPDDDGRAIQYVLNELTNRHTVPNVFLNGQTIGGGDELQKLYATGQLKLMLEKVLGQTTTI